MHEKSLICIYHVYKVHKEKKYSMKAGFGKGEIVFPEELFPLEGFCGIHDNPHVRVMALDSGTDKMALAALELVNCPAREVEICRQMISEAMEIPIGHVWIHMTHAITTPHEPGPMGPPDKRPPVTEEDLKKRELFYTAIETAMKDALEELKEKYTEVRFGWGTGMCEVNTNRDIETPFGWWVGEGSSRPSNHKLSVLCMEDYNGAPIGYFVSYGLKPCAVDNSGMKEGTRLVSSEVCGMACTKAEQELGAPVLFCMSAAGDQIPVKTSFRDVVNEQGEVQLADEGTEQGFIYAEEQSSVMGQSIVQIAGAAVCDKTEAKTGWKAFSFPWDTRKSGKRSLQKTLVHEPGEKAAEVTAELFRFGDAVFLAERPEVNAQTELELIEQAPFEHMILMSMVNGEMKYMPDRWSFEHATWEAQSSMLMPGAAEKFVEEAVTCMKALR